MLVLHFSDERQLVLNLVLDLRRNASRPATPGPLVGEPSEVARRGLTLRDDLGRVLVLQLVETEVAHRRDAQRLGQQVFRVGLCEADPCAQVPFRVGLQSGAAFR